VTERRETAPSGAIPSDTALQSRAPSTVDGGCRVLLVDDSVELCRMMKILFESRGHAVQSCHDGRSAIEQARASAPDVVLLDLKLPDMSGFDVVQQLRSLKETRESVLIALSGDGEPSAIQRARQAGFHHFVLKPADIDEIEQYFPITAGSSRVAERL
jgi:CheY-like chemotaxis protein